MLNIIKQMVAPLLMSMDELPLALLSDILSRVSSTSLQRCRRVCKRWRDVVGDSYFRNSVHRAREPVLLYRGVKEEKIYLLKKREEALTKMIWIEEFWPRNYMLRGACNGLLFVAHVNDAMKYPELLINPLTKRIVKLPRAPDLSPDMSVYGLGFDRSTNTYKMVRINVIDFNEKSRTCTMGARIYDFKKQSWRTCKAPPPPSRSSRPCRSFVFASGALNWFLLSCLSSEAPLARVMLSFDLTKEEFSLIPIPDVFFDCGESNLGTRMHELGGTLVLVHSPDKKHNDVWVLGDYTRREWTRKYRIRPPCAGGCYYTVVGPYGRDKLILRHRVEEELYLYDVNKDRFAKCLIKDIARNLLCCATLSLVSVKH